MLVPEELKEDRTGRSEKLIPLYVRSLISLHRGSKRVDISTSVDNVVKDHRLRAVFPSGIKTDYSWADSKFDVVKRSIKPELRTKEHLEEPSKTHPYDSFVDLADSDKGFAIISDGLTEFEVQDNPQREIAITLLRCVGDLSREDLLTRPGGAGWPQRTPDAQCQGDYTFNYSIYPHTGDWLKSKVYKEALNYRVALRAVHDFTIEKKDIKKPLPSQANFITLSPDNLVISCLKKAEDDEMLVLRFYNISNKSTKGKVSSFKKIKKAYLLNMNEEIKGVLKVAKNSIPVNASPKKIMTLGLRF
jgi:alpha-mannosidase